jgi:hypothetical protein
MFLEAMSHEPVPTQAKTYVWCEKFAFPVTLRLVYQHNGSWGGIGENSQELMRVWSIIVLLTTLTTV